MRCALRPLDSSLSWVPRLCDSVTQTWAELSAPSDMILRNHIIYIIIKIVYISLWYHFCFLNKYYVDAHHVADVKQHGQEVLGYVQYAFSG